MLRDCELGRHNENSHGFSSCLSMSDRMIIVRDIVFGFLYSNHGNRTLDLIGERKAISAVEEKRKISVLHE